MKQNNKFFQSCILDIKRSFGFTLVELLVVISIIGILATLALVSFTQAQKQARDTQRKSDIKQYQIALESYAAKNNGIYPIQIVNGNLSSVCSATLKLDSCPDDPDTTVHYTYQSADGAGYTLTAKLESKDVYWFVSSNGTVTEATMAPAATATPGSGLLPNGSPCSDNDECQSGCCYMATHKCDVGCPL